MAAGQQTDPADAQIDPASTLPQAPSRDMAPTFNTHSSWSRLVLEHSFSHTLFAGRRHLLIQSLEGAEHPSDGVQGCNVRHASSSCAPGEPDLLPAFFPSYHRWGAT
jgi:hypothetical protein